jgi:hypothetical protein
VLEPLLRFRKWHLMRGDFLKNVGAWAPGAAGIRKLLEQTTAQGIDDAPFVLRGIALCVQVCLSSSVKQRIYI